MGKLTPCQMKFRKGTNKTTSPKKKKKNENLNPRTKTTLSNKSKRTPGPYALFLQSMKSAFKGDIKSFSRAVAAKWRELEPAEKEKFINKAQSLQSKSKSPCKNSACSTYLKFYRAAYTCIRREHPEWSAKQVRAEVMRNYSARTCPCV